MSAFERVSDFDVESVFAAPSGFAALDGLAASDVEPVSVFFGASALLPGSVPSPATRMISIVSYVARVLEKVMSRDVANN